MSKRIVRFFRLSLYIQLLWFFIPYLLSTHLCFGAGLEVKPTPISEEGQRAKTSEPEILLKLQGAIHAHIAMLPMYLTTSTTPTETDLWSSGCLFETDKANNTLVGGRITNIVVLTDSAVTICATPIKTLAANDFAWNRYALL